MNLDTKNGSTISSERLAALAREYGTPLYVYDMDSIEAQYGRVESCFGGCESVICYALKANSNLGIVQLLARLGSGADCVSINEVKRAVIAGVPARKIIFSGVGKTDQEIREAMSMGILSLNIESEDELRDTEDIARELDTTADISIRVNPDVEIGSHPYISTGISESKFGVDIDSAKEMFIKARNSRYINPVGIHFHIGSQVLDKVPLLTSFHRVAKMAREFKSCGLSLRFFNIGGGFGIDYTGHGRSFDIHAYAQEIMPEIDSLGMTLICEPGRFIVGNSGYLLTKVIREKKTSKKRFVIVDAAMNDLIRPSLYDAVHRITRLESGACDMKLDDTSSSKCDVVGPVCESGDYLAKDVNLAPCAKGDLLLIGGAGAYSYSMSSNYNARMRPAEVGFRRTDSGIVHFLLKDRESFESSIENEMKYTGQRS